ncbi:hypothetical protein BSKO_07964 [Bryopsis sp. KO-2023]|nr:hypothetical protein BSKO_07964 [Bryopsis sp. KO-2023]
MANSRPNCGLRGGGRGDCLRLSRFKSRQVNVRRNRQCLRRSASADLPDKMINTGVDRTEVRESWDTLMRWSRIFRTRSNGKNEVSDVNKIAVLGGGSFGTAVGTALARQSQELDVVMLLRDADLVEDINNRHCNTRYLEDFRLPTNLRATTNKVDAIYGAEYAVHAVPVQHSRQFLRSIKHLLPQNVPVISVSKGLESDSCQMMSELIRSALERRQPSVFMSGPSFAREIMERRPTSFVAASRDRKLARRIQQLFASQYVRVNTSADVVGVEVCGATKNVLAIAAGIVEGLDLGHNAMAGLIAQGCSEIRWLSKKMGARPETVAGLSGLGDIMLTCYGDLSRNRTVGLRLGKGESLSEILETSTQVAEGVATAGAVIGLARKYKVQLPVLTAVAQVLDGNLTPSVAVEEIMNLPQIEEH